MSGTDSRGGGDELCFPSISTNLRKQKINPKWRILVNKIVLQDGDLITKHLSCVSDASDDSKASGVGDGGSELWTGGHTHAGEEYRVVDLEQICDGSSDSF